MRPAGATVASLQGSLHERKGTVTFTRAAFISAAWALLLPSGPGALAGEAPPEAELIPGPPLPELAEGPEERKEGKTALRARRRLLAEKQKALREHYLEARRRFRAGDYREAVEACDKALGIDPENPTVQRVRYAAERARQALRLSLEEERERFRDEEALADLDRESQVPEERTPLERPRLPLWAEEPEPAELKKLHELLQQKVSMNFIEADLDYVLQTLFKISGVNIIAEQSVVEGKTLTLHVEEVPLEEILKFIEKNYDGIKYTVTDYAVWLTSPEKPAMTLKSYQLSRGLVGQSQFQMGVRTSGGARATGPSAVSGTTGRSLQRTLAQAAGAGGGAQAAGSFLESLMEWMAGWEDEWPEGSRWYLDRKTNTLFVLTTTGMHKQIRGALELIDVPPIQVLLTTKFIEVKMDDEFALGFDLQSGEVDAEGNVTSGWRTGLLEPGPGLNALFTMGSGDQRFQGILRAFQKVHRAKLLSAPQIIALNNFPATISVSKSFSYPTQYQAVQTTTTSEGATVQNVDAFIPSQFEQVDVGFFLEFVPSVGRDMKNITLDIHARVDEVEQDIKDFYNFVPIFPMDGEGGASLSSTIPRPVIDGREFTTKLVVEDGGVIVIGGLLRNQKIREMRKVPILGDIPLLGLLFRSRSVTNVKSNLVIIVQARILHPSGREYASVEEPSEPEWTTETAPATE